MVSTSLDCLQVLCFILVVYRVFSQATGGPLYQEPPASRPRTCPSCQISCDRRLETKCAVNVKHSDRSETTLPAPQSTEELSSVRAAPAAKKVGDHCHRSCAHDPGTQNALSWWTEELFTSFFILLSGREE